MRAEVGRFPSSAAADDDGGRHTPSELKRSRSAWRSIVDGPGDGAWNMAVDEALLASYASSSPPEGPTLRLYGWHPPALSLGRSQAAATAYDPAYLRSHAIDLVRRPTGGGAVLHEHERTYAVVGRLRQEPFPGGVLDTYRRVASALCMALGRLGVDARSENRSRPLAGRRPAVLCFAAPSAYEITADGLKLVGSAQLRRSGAFLQHGSILVRADPERQRRATGFAGPVPRCTDLAAQVGRLPELVLDRALVEGFEECFAAELRPGRLTAREVEHATWLRARKHRTRCWTLEGRAVC